jgi:hypothetical protein
VRSAAWIFLLLGVLLGITTAGLAAWDERALAIVLLGAAAGASLLTALALIVLSAAPAKRAARWDPDDVLALPDVSAGAAAVGAGACVAVLGLVFGMFMVMLGAGVMLLGLAEVVREQRALRRARDAAAQADARAARR